MFLIFYKYGMTDRYLTSRYKIPIDLAILFGVPASILWDWFDFKKKDKDRNS